MKKGQESDQKMQKKHNDMQIKGLIVVAVVALFGAVMSFFGVATLDKKVSELDQRINLIATAQQQSDVRANGVKYDGEDGKTAFELLKKSHKIDSETSEYGEYIVAIDGVKQGDNKYWVFYVNGKLAKVGASSYKTKNGEKIEWKLEEYKN